MDHRYFPFFVDITGKKVLQVGAGNIALRRTESLLRFGADVTVTASEIRMEFLQLQQKYGRKRLELIRSPFMHGMTRGYELVLTATGDKKADLEVYFRCTGYLHHSLCQQRSIPFRQYCEWRIQDQRPRAHAGRDFIRL